MNTYDELYNLLKELEGFEEISFKDIKINISVLISNYKSFVEKEVLKNGL